MKLTREEKIREVEEASVAAAWRRPDVIIEDRPGWFRTTTPSMAFEAYNGIFRCVLDETEAETRVAEVVADYRARGAEFRWLVGPSTRPARMPELLAAQGLKLSMRLLGMVADVEDLHFEMPTGVTVEEVTAATVGEYASACVAGWGSPPEAGDSIRQDMRRSYAEGGDPRHYYLSRYQGEPAGTGVLLPLQRSGYLMASSVDPKFRGKGVYRGLVAKRVLVLRERGIPLVTIQAIHDTSAPICRKLGFETICELQSFKS